MNARLGEDLRVLEDVIAARLDAHLGRNGRSARPGAHGADECGRLADLHRGEPLSIDEYLLVLLALVPHVAPACIGRLIGQYLPDGGDLPEFGGVRGENHRGVLPTGETAQFLLAGDDLARRIEVQRLLSGEHWFAKEHVLWLDPVREGEPAMSGRLVLDPEVVERLTTGSVSVPRFSNEFPAEHIDTDMEWDDVVLHPDTRRQIEQIEHWMQFNDMVRDDWGMHARVKPGYRALFHGPPGTGKTLTAALLGKRNRRRVFRLDLSRTISRYIGETEKTLARVFDRAQGKDWILFFDEADALFGKRTEIRDAHDKYANQEVAYLLQRIETFAGLVILATNRRGNLDDAFLRRFQIAVQFPMPRPDERHDLWSRVFPQQITIGDDVDWRDISARYELSGAAIVNVAHFCALEALANETRAITRAALDAAIVRELVKDGKVV